jgi:hypothetical protein
MHRNKIKTPTQGAFMFGRQMSDLTALKKDGVINGLNIKINRHLSRSGSIVFQLGKAFFVLPDGRKIEVDFSEYRIKIEYGGFCKPRVFVLSHKLDRNCGHINGDNTLCLYKLHNFVWKNTNSLAKDVIPLIYAWLYFYQDWCRTNIWYGFSAKH